MPNASHAPMGHPPTKHTQAQVQGTSTNVPLSATQDTTSTPPKPSASHAKPMSARLESTAPDATIPPLEHASTAPTRESPMLENQPTCLLECLSTPIHAHTHATRDTTSNQMELVHPWGPFLMDCVHLEPSGSVAQHAHHARVQRPNLPIMPLTSWVVCVIGGVWMGTLGLDPPVHHARIHSQSVQPWGGDTTCNQPVHTSQT